MDEYCLLSDPINIVESKADTRSLIMPHQKVGSQKPVKGIITTNYKSSETIS